MPLVDEDLLPPLRAPRVSVEASVAVEIEWALASSQRPDFLVDHPALDAVYARHPDLIDRVRSMWGPDEAMSCGCFLELLVLAHHGGLLFSTDAETLLARLDELCRDPAVGPDTYPLHSETDDDRAAVWRRLTRLRRSPALRQRYVTLMVDLWRALRPEWETTGRVAVEDAMARRRELQATGVDWHEVARGDWEFGSCIDTALASVGPGAELVVVPAYFTHRGLFLDLPGVVVVGVRAEATTAQARARTEALARRLKALSDPTRLAIVDTLRRGPRTVTELATSFSLAQPTVSNHVKLLRDAGLVADVRDGTRRRLVVQNDVVETLIASLQSTLVDRSVATGSPGARTPGAGGLSPAPA